LGSDSACYSLDFHIYSTLIECTFSYRNKVLRRYIENKYPVVPINKKTLVVEEIACCESLDMLKTKIENGAYQGVDSIGQVGLSVITPPGVTKGILEDAYRLGIRNFFLQPGTYDDLVDGLLQSGMKDALVIKGCVLVELA
jgi:predicted CoA-binding protein